MNSSALIDTMPPLFKSLGALRRAHTQLLAEYQKHDDEQDENTLPDDFVKEVETFLDQASRSGALLDIDEDRSDAQALLNYWTTVLYNSGQTPRPTILAKFDEEVVSLQIGARCPYRGLQAFHQEDRAVFFGRRQLARDMTKTLQRGNFLAVVGLSGSGKSSVVRAGLIPALQEGALTDSESWTYHDPIVPGPEPLKSLSELTRPADVPAPQWYQQHARQFVKDEAHLLQLLSGAGKTAVVVVDQFEELFTLSQDETERQAFVANLVRLAKAHDPRHLVIITMRSEFDTYVARFPELQELFDAAHVRVPPLNPLDLRKAIEKPAERSGLSFEAGLVEELVQQVLGEPAGLPLLQFTLYKLWENREGKNITRATYDQLGGSPRVVLANVADETYKSFKLIQDQNISRRIMLRIVRPGAGLDVTSNRVSRASLHTVDARDNVDRVLAVWVAKGLLRVTPGAKREDDQVEVMHEALIRNWPMLVDWLEEERVHLRKRLQLTSAAQQWDGHQRDPGGLLRGTLLAEALTYDDLNMLEAEFVEESQRAAAAAERDKERHQQRLIAARKLQLRLATVFLVVAAGLLAWAISRTRVAASAITKANDEEAKATVAKGEAETARRRIDETQKAAALELAAASKAADKKLADLRLRTDEELGKLEVYKTQAADARKKVSDSQREINDLNVEKSTLEKQRDEAKKVANDARETVSQAEQSLQRLQGDIAELNEQKSTLKKQKDEAEKVANDARETVSQAEQKLKTLQAEIAELNNQKSTLERQKDQAQKTAESAINEINRYAIPAQRVILSPETLGSRRLVRPLRPGLSVSTLSTGGGTLCCVVRDSSGKKYLLGADYLMGGRVGESVIQPGTIDKGTERDKVAIVSRSDKPHWMVLAELLPGIEYSNVIPGVGVINGTSDQVKVGDTLVLVGRTSGAVKGRVTRVNVDMKIGDPYGGITNFRYLIVTEKVSGPGDSGSPVLDKDGRLVGILIAGNPDVSIIVPIRQILLALNVELAQ